MGDDVLRPGSVRGVQAVRIGGQPVHHRVPILRPPAAPSRPEASARACSRPPRGRPRAASLRLLRRSTSTRSTRRAPVQALAGLAGCWSAGPTPRHTPRSCWWRQAARCGWCGTPSPPLFSHDRSLVRSAVIGGSCSPRQFAYLKGWYAFVTLLAIALFGWLLERRHGPVVVLALFLGAGATGALVASAVYAEPIVSGGNAAALACWRPGRPPTCRRRARATTTRATCSAPGRSRRSCWRSLRTLPPEASWLAGVRAVRSGWCSVSVCTCAAPLSCSAERRRRRERSYHVGLRRDPPTAEEQRRCRSASLAMRPSSSPTARSRC